MQEKSAPFLVSFWSFKGGVGKSTLSQAVAAGLTARQFKVALVDIDDTASTSTVVAAHNRLPFPVVQQVGAETDAAEFVVVDHPPHSSAVSRADVLVVPVIPALGSSAATKATLEAVPAGIRVVVAINEINASNAEREEYAQLIERDCVERGIPSVRIRRRTAHEYAQNRGATVYQRDVVKSLSHKGLKEARDDVDGLVRLILEEIAKNKA